MLEQINSARNMGNANTALANANFARADQISTEFLIRLIRLSGEDFNGALIDSVFNEGAAVLLVNSLIEEIEHSELEDLSPAQLAPGFQTILNQVLERRQPSPDEHDANDDTNFDDIYEDDEEEDRAQPNPQPNSDNFIDDEAEEVTEGQESEPEAEEEEQGADDIEDSDCEQSGEE